MAFKSEKKGPINLVRCPKIIDDTACKQLDAFAGVWVKLPVKLHVFDFRACEEIAPKFYKSLQAFNESSKHFAQKIVSINLNKSLRYEAISSGMEKTLSPIDSLEKYLKSSIVIPDQKE